jgi:hypothetical protein
MLCRQTKVFLRGTSRLAPTLTPSAMGAGSVQIFVSFAAIGMFPIISRRSKSASPLPWLTFLLALARVGPCRLLCSKAIGLPSRRVELAAKLTKGAGRKQSSNLCDILATCLHVSPINNCKPTWMKPSPRRICRGWKRGCATMRSCANDCWNWQGSAKRACTV